MEVKIDDPWQYIESFEAVQFRRLYKNPASTIVIFRRRLSSLAQSLVLALLSLSEPVSEANLELLIKAECTASYTRAVRLLQQYHILQTSKHESADTYILTPEFAQSFKQVLNSSNEACIFDNLLRVNPVQSVATTDLNQYASNKWNSILGLLVGTAHTTANHQVAIPLSDIVDLLLRGQLISGPQAILPTTQFAIIQAGFAFVLEDVGTQLWVLLFLIVSKAAAEGHDAVEVLSFICVVSILETGQVYLAASLSKTQCYTLELLSSLGIVYQINRNDDGGPTHFSPTHMAVMLSTTSQYSLGHDGLVGVLDQQHSEENQGFIIVETNFRVYAYTSSPLQSALLSLFVNLRSRHPNLVTGKITRSSIQRAVRQGISADQIVSYLSTHAHPQMYAASAQSTQEGRDVQLPILPTNVVRQIHLWQLEWDRMTLTPGTLLTDFATTEEYRFCCRRAEESGILVWKHDERNMLFVIVTSLEGLQLFAVP